jgi:hypothetical protein
MTSWLDAINNALPLINLAAVFVLGALHVKNATNIANATTGLAGDAIAASHGNAIAQLPALIADVKALGEAAGVATTAQPVPAPIPVTVVGMAPKP